MAYTKLFHSLITSTIWSEDDKTRIVWITILALADRNGEVQGSIPGLARMAGVPIEDCRRAVDTFLSPDPDSRTKDDEGRRIEAIDGGWHLLNHAKYRDMATDDDRKRNAALRQQRARAKKSRNSHANVTPESPQIPHSDTDAEADHKERNKGATCFASPTHGGSVFTDKNPRPYPTSEKEMYALLEAAGYEVDEDKDGDFYNRMVKSGWTIRGKAIADWMAAYAAFVAKAREDAKS